MKEETSQPRAADTLDKVLYIGPDKNAQGGIGSVMLQYSRHITPFHYLPTNSRHGTAAGLVNLALALARMPIERLKGRRLLHIHYATRRSWPRKLLVARWGRALGFKIIMHCHAGNITNLAAERGTGYVAKALSVADHHVVLSDFWQRYFTTVLGLEPVTIANNMVNRPPLSSLTTAADGPLTMLFLGRLCDNKGIYDLLEAVARVVKSGRKMRLIVGGNDEVDRFTASVKALGLEQVVDFRGWMGDEAREQAYAESQVLLLPSYIEGLPICILEAMARRKGVVASTVGGIPEIIADGKNGFLIEAGDIDALTAALERYIDNPSLIAVHGALSAEKVEPYYPDKVVEALTAIYRRVLD
jgi:glycosyltransferase involved in cell wall biosynthesis